MLARPSPTTPVTETNTKEKTRMSKHTLSANARRASRSNSNGSSIGNPARWARGNQAAKAMRAQHHVVQSVERTATEPLEATPPADTAAIDLALDRVRDPDQLKGWCLEQMDAFGKGWLVRQSIDCVTAIARKAGLAFEPGLCEIRFQRGSMAFAAYHSEPFTGYYFRRALEIEAALHKQMPDNAIEVRPEVRRDGTVLYTVIVTL